MILGIRLLNFQGFRGDQRIELGDLNLVFGPNSSGKSSLARALQIMSQSVEGWDPEVPFLLPVYDGRQINVRQENLEYGRGLNPYLDFGFGVKLRTPYASSVWISIVEQSSLDDDNHLINEYEFNFSDDPDRESIKISMYWNRERPKEPILRFSRGDESQFIDWFKHFFDPFSLIEDEGTGLFSSREVLFKQVYPSLYQAIHKEFGSKAFLDRDEIPSFSVFAEEFLSFYNEVVSELDNIPEYIFLHDSKGLSSAETLLSLFIKRVFLSTLSEVKSQLVDLEVVDPIRIVPKGMDSSFVFSQKFIELLSRDLLYVTEGRYSVEQRRWAVQDRVEYFWEVFDHFTGTVTGLENVGQGITQILEVLVTLRMAPGFTVLQQPDLHLHPKAVGNLGDLIFQTLAEDIFSGRRLLIETHSESLLTRLQKHRRLSVTHEDLTASDFSFKVFYCEPVPPAIVDQSLIDELSDTGLPQEFLEYVKGSVSRQFDIHGFDWLSLDYYELSREAREAMSDYCGFNYISELRVDHLGDVIDPFPVSFADLRVQDLLS